LSQFNFESGSFELDQVDCSPGLTSIPEDSQFHSKFTQNGSPITSFIIKGEPSETGASAIAGANYQKLIDVLFI